MYNCLNTGNEMEKINQMKYKWYIVKRGKNPYQIKISRQNLKIIE